MQRWRRAAGGSALIRSCKALFVIVSIIPQNDAHLRNGFLLSSGFHALRFFLFQDPAGRRRERFQPRRGGHFSQDVHRSVSVALDPFVTHP